MVGGTNTGGGGRSAHKSFRLMNTPRRIGAVSPEREVRKPDCVSKPARMFGSSSARSRLAP